MNSSNAESVIKKCYDEVTDALGAIRGMEDYLYSLPAPDPRPWPPPVLAEKKIKLHISGRPISKKNKHIIKHAGRRRYVGLSQAAGLWQGNAAAELAAQAVGMGYAVNECIFDSPVRLFAEFIIVPGKGRHPDIDGPVTSAMDALEKSGVIANDEQIVEMKARRLNRSDTDLEPGIYIELRELLS